MDWGTPNGTISVVAFPDTEPMTYQVGDQTSGMCIELLYDIARDLGYDLETRTTALGSLIVEIQSGKANVAASCFSITPERKQKVDKFIVEPGVMTYTIG